MQLIQKADIQTILKEYFAHIVHEYLDMRKRYTKGLAREHTFDQKQQVVESQISENNDHNARIGLRIVSSPTV